MTLPNASRVRILVSAQCGRFCVASDDGEVIFAQIKAALDAGKSVAVSFAGVESLSTAFLNSAIGELLGVFESDDLNERLQIIEEEIKPDQMLTLRRVVANAKLYYTDRERFRAMQREMEAA